MGAGAKTGRARLMALGLGLVAALLCGTLAPAAQAAAPVTIAKQGAGAGKVNGPASVAVRQSSGELYVADRNNFRIDKFDSAGNFLLAWGFGVADGHSLELQTCGPEASPPTKRCFHGEGANTARSSGAVAPDSIAVEQSSGAVFAADTLNHRVSKFGPDGEFLLAFGGGVASGGAEGTGDTEAGSATVKAVAMAKKAFAEGQILTGPGIAAGTEITNVSAFKDSITLSKPATATAAGVTLIAAEDPGNVPTDEVQLLTLGAGVSSGNFKLSFTPPLASAQTTANIPYNASAAQVQSALEALAGIGAGNVEVVSVNPGGEAGVPGGPYAIEFGGERYADTDVAQFARANGEPNLNTSEGTTIETAQAGAVAAEVCTSDCVGGQLATLPGVFAESEYGPQGASPGALAFDSSGDLWVASGGRLQRFDPSSGSFLSEVAVPADSQVRALAINPSTDDFYVLGPRGGNETQRISRVYSGTGEYTLSFEGQSTAPIPYQAGAQTVQAALEGLSGIGAGNVSVRRASFDVLEVFFIHDLGGRDLPQMTASGGTPPVTVSTSGGPGKPGSVRKLDSAGALLETFDDDPGDLPQALGVDSAGNLYLGDAHSPYRFLRFNPAGEQTSQFGGGQVDASLVVAGGRPLGNALAIDESSEALYSAGEFSVQRFSAPEPGPLPRGQHAEDLLPTTATLAAELNPENHATSYHFEYGTTTSYGSETPEEALPGTGFEEEEVGAELEGLIPDTTYHFRIVATNHCNGAEPLQACTVEGEDTTFTTPAAVGVDAQWATDVAARSATLHGQLDPLGVAGEWWIEYGTSEGYGSETAKADLPESFGTLDLQAALGGLSPATVYHYRFAASDERDANPYTVHGPDATFATLPGALGFQLPDGRAWEMVSPPEKHGGRIKSAVFSQVQAAADGESLAYLSLGSLEASPEGNRLTEESTQLARRAEGGQWSSRDLTPPHTEVTGIPVGGGLEYKLFSPSLGSALLEPRDHAPLSPEASERTPYLRQDAEPPVFTPLVTGKEGFADVPPGTKFGGDPKIAAPNGAPTVRGASADLAHVALVSATPLAAGAAGAPGGSLYEWTASAAPADRLQAISVPPGGGGAIEAELGWGSSGQSNGSVRHAISEDGSRVFWTSASPRGLYLRDTARGETIRLDTVQPGGFGTGAVDPRFLGADRQGTVAFFADTQNLTEDANEAGADLYRCQVVVQGGALGCALSDLSAQTQNPADPFEGASLRGLALGMSEDATKAYFVATGVLDAVPNEEGDSAVAGRPNLYLWQEGEGVRFIATLAEADHGDWGESAPGELPSSFLQTATVSPSGRYLAFMSESPLTGYDNRAANGGGRAQEVFRYDAASDALACVSCNPSGGRPLALRPVATGETGELAEEFDPQELWTGQPVAALLPEATRASNEGLSLYRTRAVHDDGRVFFNAADSLVAADTNGAGDVYQYEPSGVGSCGPSAAGAGTAVVPGGCVSLLSSGTGGTASFLDASESGEDVFFYTPARLSVTDEDSELDVYDARVGGEPAVLQERVECLGEACQPPVAAPADPTPASAAFQGAGNLSEAPAAGRRACPKGRRKVRRHGKARCVKPAQHRKHRKHRKHHKGRAGR